MAEAAAKRGGLSAAPDARALRIVGAWNAQARRGEPAEFFPTFATALAAHCWRVTYCCPACRQMGFVDLRNYADAHHPRAPISVLIPKLSCDRCCPNPPLAVLIEIGDPFAPAPVHQPEPIAAPAAKPRMLPRPTLGELVRKPPRWFWLSCDNCAHRAAIAIVPYIIRWGPDTSSDRLCKGARCKRCGQSGASLDAPAWLNRVIGEQPFPTDEN
ncbi:MAG: hypothetical protein Q7T81_01640 [Pseudolabrys sp.]|nr:hypothetical protein [Pseudolabrys sp.]